MAEWQGALIVAVPPRKGGPGQAPAPARPHCRASSTLSRRAGPGSRRGPHLVSWLLNFLVTTLPSSRLSQSATRWDRSWCELPLKSTMLRMARSAEVAAVPPEAATAAGKSLGLDREERSQEELEGAGHG